MFNLYSSSTTCNNVYLLYKNILNSYVSDYYLEDHWNTKLSNSWKLFLENLDVGHIADLLECKKLRDIIPPLSILCLQKILTNHSIGRNPITDIQPSFLQDVHFMKYFWKNVKLKKRHEIEIIAEICYQAALKTNCFNIIDVGSGLGHLSRMLAYGYGFTVCTFEANKQLSEMASKLDMELEKTLLQRSISHSCQKRIIHVNHRIEEDLTPDKLKLLVTKAFKNHEEDFKFGIVGLHPCGNLGSMLLQLYNNCQNIVFINIVSCCYMKLSLGSHIFKGYPLSQYYIKNNYKLDYMSCETACHAIENYISKLKAETHYDLKIHSFRAGLESILVNKDIKMKHCAIANVKYDKTLKFVDYCDKALRQIEIELNDVDVKSFEEIIERSWKKVVKFYSIRLFLAPIIESIILYDRLLYLKESNSDCDILPVFDCTISPRNHILSAQKHL